MNGLDLFSGYGGITIGVEDYATPILYCEKDEYAQGILLSRMDEGTLPFAPIWNDVATLDGKELKGLVDIIWGGFPCQDISFAGSGKGLAGERSGLFYEIVRLTKEINPQFVFLENVPAIRTRGLREIVKTLRDLRYECRWTSVSAASVGANQERKRWFLLANSMCERLEGAEFRVSKEPRSSGRSKTRRAKRWENWWTVEPRVDRVVNGTPYRVDRIKALGNGVVPLQVKEAFEKLLGVA